VTSSHRPGGAPLVDADGERLDGLRLALQLKLTAVDSGEIDGGSLVGAGVHEDLPRSSFRG
jgi:hypothetical protein